MLVDALLAKNSTVNVRGLVLGDACMGTDVICGEKPDRVVGGGPWSSLLFSAGQGCIALATFNAIITACPLPLLQNGPMASATLSCAAAVAQAAVDCPEGAFYNYNYLDQCPPDSFSVVGRTASSRGREWGNKSKPRGADALPPAPVQPSGYPCGVESALTTWITHPRVKRALNVAPNAVHSIFVRHAVSCSRVWSNSGTQAVTLRTPPLLQDNGEGFVYNITVRTWSVGDRKSTR